MKKILFIAIALMTSLTIAAQTPDEATLTVSGSGENEEKATLVALRSAIEQTYGTFVSANTDILNDELIKDEVVSISAGNIKSYKKLSTVTLDNGHILVTLSATVSIGKLVNYAQNKGATTEFAGATLAMNIKLMKLREKNALEALCNMWQTVSELSKNAFDYKIEIGQPILCYRTLWKEDVSWKKPYGYENYKKGIKIKGENGYRIPIVVTALANEYTSQIAKLANYTYQSLCLTENEVEEWSKVGNKPYLLRVPLPLTTKKNFNKFELEGKKAFKNIINSLLNFIIEENSGENVSYVMQEGYSQNIIAKVCDMLDNDPFYINDNPYKDYNISYRYHLVDNKKIIHSSLPMYPGSAEEITTFWDYFDHDSNNQGEYQEYRKKWCGGFLAYNFRSASPSLRFDYHDWILPTNRNKIPKALDPTIEKNLRKQYEKAIRQRDKDAIYEIESKLYDYEKIEQPLHKMEFEIFVPYDRMNKLKGFTIRKNN